ncbi:MAG: hypothetical protein HQL96_05410 [Magnetococcales bacterium]|nr:hypothetical protein [Magnetococcales bacterium]
MTAQAGYLLARIQARHGQRLDENQWRMLSSAHSFNRFLSQARETSLGPWLEGIDPIGEIHHLEWSLRDAFRRHVVEVVSWAPPAWRAAGSWLTTLPDLEAMLHRRAWGMTHPWLQWLDDQTHPLPPPGTDPFAWWLEQWRLLWPKDPGAHAQLLELIRYLQTALTRNNVTWQELNEGVTLRFRRHAMHPTVLFSHLLLTAMDLNRLRGELSRRWLFARDDAP